MFRFAVIVKCSDFLPLYPYYHRGVSCALLSIGQFQYRYGFRTMTSLQNRDDDLTPVMNPLEFRSATTLWSKQVFFNRITDLLHYNKDDLERIYKMNKKSLSEIFPRTITANITSLLSKGVTESSIKSFPKILAFNSNELFEKLTVLGNLKDLKDINHVVPLLSVSLDVLERVVEISQCEDIEHGNRIYFLNAKTGVDCETIARYFATNIRIYRISLEKFRSNLDYCLQHLEPLDVVKNLFVLAFASSSLDERLQMLKNTPLQQVKPWMIAVPGLVLKRSFDKAVNKGVDLKFENRLTEIWYDYHVLGKIENALGCNEDEAKIVYEGCQKTVSFLENIEFLKGMNIRKDTIVRIPEVLTLERKDLAEKLAILTKLKGLRDLNDMIPLCMLKVGDFEQIVCTLNSEGLEHGTNRIYHFADKAAANPTDVAIHFSRRTFIFHIPQKYYLQKLDLFLRHMDCKDIFGDMWVFKCSLKTAAKRIAKMRQETPDRKIMPWMVRSPDIPLERTLQLTKENNAALGGNESIMGYFCQRLGFERKVVNTIVAKYPSIRNVRVTKAKQMLDYLLEELDYTPHEIALTPKILKHNLETIRERIDQLKEMGCRPRSLAIVCASKRRYSLFLEELLASKNLKKKVSTAD
ncbi:uncharacterized protein LOC129779610 [Toxorhynchites rutilus septentrionalis]|uniref:uncharacterized protein LOC129779610 n=1 Tax=Toxorhynchites rutilus septentrionalis TaxID=329112 RepID=UPI00247A3001|nr:uncharacterized protein LOC129779610 [Toxorhynchites rutilus septentrionalis]